MMERNLRKSRVGIVTRDKMDKTISVKVEVKVAHPVYKKRINRTTVFKAHDENNEAKVGDKVRITETRPLSRLKRWRLVQIIDRAK